MTNKVKLAVFPVGGLGTRFLPATKAMPKEMLTVVDKPLIQYAYEEARAAGIEQFIFITGRNKNVISNHFDHAYELQQVLTEKEKKDQLALTKDWLPKAGNVAFIRQQEPLGLGHAIACARHFAGNQPFAVLLADEMFLSPQKTLLQEMVEVYEQRGGNIIGVSEVPKERVSSYGVIAPKQEDANGVITIGGMVEKPKPEDAPSNLSIVGRYVLEPQIFDYLAKGQKSKDGEIQLTDAMASMLHDRPFYGVKLKGERFDCGGRKGFMEANIAYALQRNDMRGDMQKLLARWANHPAVGELV